MYAAPSRPSARRTCAASELRVESETKVSGWRRSPNLLLGDCDGAALHEQFQQLEGMGLQPLRHAAPVELARRAVENEGTELDAHGRLDPGEPSARMLGRGTPCRNDSGGRSREAGISQGMRRDSVLRAPTFRTVSAPGQAAPERSGRCPRSGLPAGQLADARCQALLDEFADATGRPLRSVLAAHGLAVSDYMRQVFFYDAPEWACRSVNLAVTKPGNRAIFVCGARFQKEMSRNSRNAEAIVIHEVLHSLGLGENPPSSDHITARVRAQCGQGGDVAQVGKNQQK